MNQFIYDVHELKQFFAKYVPHLTPNEVYFVSLSARNKYLTSQEREELGLGRTEMMERRIIREKDWDKFIRTIRKFETHEEAILSKTGIPIPSKCMTIYWNINPSNTLLALKEFNKILNEYYFELSTIQIGNRTSGNDLAKRFNKLDTTLMNCYQKNHGIKHWIDIDFDVDKTIINMDMFYKHLEDNQVTYVVIDTKSGYHVMLKRDTVKYDYNKSIRIAEINYHNFLCARNLEVKFEIALNKNAMIPLPGCLQGGYPVKVIKEWRAEIG